jgi:hypothetical protein
MDIGNTIRCYTVEPVRDPVRRRHAGDERQLEVPVVAADHRTLPAIDATIASVAAPSLARRAGE